MTHLTLQSMNGHVGHLRGLSGPLRISIEHGADRTPLAGLGQDEGGYGETLTPGWEYPRVEEPRKPGEFFTKRRNLEPGELWNSESGVPPKPITPENNDERNLPDSLTGEKILQLPHRNYPGNFPHGWIPFEEMYAAVGPDTPPVPSGWAVPQRASGELARALDLVGPAPWVPEDAQAYDISGFANLQELEHFGQFLIPPSIPPSVTQAVTSQVQQAQAAGASPSTLSQVLAVASQAAAMYMIAKPPKPPAPTPTYYAPPAPRPVAPAPAPEEPFYKKPAVLIGGGVLLLAAIAAAIAATRKNPPRRWGRR